ncbi:hypothetical protein [Allosphingosinicella vermicomposti]|nr:hypothetical protein [Allosphingosinicella vermicomposti]
MTEFALFGLAALAVAAPFAAYELFSRHQYNKRQAIARRRKDRV